MIPYIFIYLSSLLISLFKNKRNKYIICSILVILLTLFAGTRGDIDNDHLLYKFYFLTSVNGNFSKLQTELSVYIIPNILNWVTRDFLNWSFVVFAFLSLSTKLFAIKDYRFFSLAIILYLGNLFFIQDMTTIRASVASGFFLLSIKDIEEKKDKQFFIKIALAFLFHYSSVIFIGVWLINKFKVKYKWLIIALGFAILVPIFKLNFIEILHLGAISNKAEIYMQMKNNEEEKLNLFNFKILFSLFFLIVLYWNKKKINYKGFDLMLKIHFLSLILFFLFSTTGLTFSLRTFELLSIVQIILYPLILLCFNKKLKLLGYILIISISFVFFYYNIFVSNLFKYYTSWLF